MPESTPGSRTPDAGIEQEAANCRPGEGKVLPLGQEFGQVLVVAALIGRLGQRHHARSDALVEGVGRLTASIAMDQSAGSLLAIRRQQTACLPQSNP